MRFFPVNKISIPLFIASSFLGVSTLSLMLLFFKLNFSSSYVPDHGTDQVLYASQLEAVKDPLITLSQESSSTRESPSVSAYDPYFGSDNAPIKLIIYSSFDCRYCQSQEEMLKKAVGRYGNLVGLVRKDYPDGPRQSGPWRASVASRCAQGQGRFWPFHDLLYSSDEYSEKNISDLARQSSLDMKEFSSCLKDDLPYKLIDANIEEAKALGITGVPFIYINERGYLGEMDENELNQLLAEEIRKIK